MDRFIVGTGRCGSTLLSRMLAEHPTSLSIFEFFNGLDAGRRFADTPMTGTDYRDLIASEQPFLTAVLRRGYEVPEIIYPFGGGSRFERGDPLPWALVGTLPRLAETAGLHPDALFDETMSFCVELPAQPAVAHHRRLFDHLVERLSRNFWIERSGSSIDYLESLCALFPQARFVHLHRDGPEAALSMREHHAYRLPIAVMYRMPVDGVPFADLGEIELHAAPRDDDAISRILRSRPPAEHFGRYWSDQLVRGLGARERLGPERYLEVRFEDLVERPREALLRISEFFDLDPKLDGWVERASALVRGVPPTRADALPPEEAEHLANACRPGRELLGQS